MIPSHPGDKVDAMLTDTPPPGSARHRILMIVERYPQLSETYIATEAAALNAAGYLVGILAVRSCDYPRQEHLPFERVSDEDEIVRRCAEVGATALHTHYLHMVPMVRRVAERANLPFTVRTHSYDVLRARSRSLVRSCYRLNHSRCIAVFGFPFIVNLLRRHGLRKDLLHESWPVIDFQRFYDEGPNGEGVMNLGAAQPKKNMKGYIDFAATRPLVPFSLYPIGYLSDELTTHNEERGSPVTIHDVVQPEDMPEVYKRHRWLVYSATATRNTVGWPMAVAEAQASGVGVCFQSARRDATTYVDGGGLVFEDFREIADVVAGPVPTSMRQQGFLAAARSDVVRHVQELDQMWTEGGA
jgi:hypothetical protein